MELRCSAGISHFLIYPNGDVYRCMADYNAGCRPIFNFLVDGLKLNQTAEVCMHPKCYAGCDVDWATKWIVEEEGKTKNKVPAQARIALKDNLRVKSWAEQEYPNKLLKKFANIIWTPTLLCNYDCAYCGCAKGLKNIGKEFPSSFPELTSAQWISIFEQQILSNFEWCTVTLAGGEPFLSKSLIPVIKIIAKKCSVNITTNLSMNLMDFVRADIKPFDFRDYSGVTFVGSLHPTANKFQLESFLARLLFLKNNGFYCSVNFVAYPEQMYLFDYYKDLFRKFSIDIVFSPWCGVDNYGHTGYLAKEEHFLDSKTVPWRSSKTQIDYNEKWAKNAYKAEINLLDKINIIQLNKISKFKIKVKNIGNKVWGIGKYGNADFKFGCRLISTEDKESPVKCESRVLFTKDIHPRAEEILEIAIDPPITLSKGKYQLKFDVVNENYFWLEDKGSKPLVLNVRIGI